jgi:N-acyl-D-aspartate/D-glutamate deacylase
VPWNWRTTAEYLDALDGTLAINAGFMVGHSAIRRVVMGAAATERAATEDEVAAMEDLLRRGLAAGALGFSSSTSSTHSDADGNLVPSCHADDEELVRLAAVCGEYPGTSLEFMPGAAPVAASTRPTS